MKTIVYINFTLTLLLIGEFVWSTFYQAKTPKVITETPETQNSIQYVDKCGEDCKKQIEEIIAKSKVEVTSAVTISPVPIVTTQTRSQTAYIPIAGPITTTSSDWYDAPGTEFYLNFNTDYGQTAYANWDASLKVKDGNGAVYARLYDVTNKIAVNGSEIAVSSKGDLTQAISGGLSFWAGNNQYRVQLKSLNGFEVTFGGGRVKIIY